MATFRAFRVAVLAAAIGAASCAAAFGDPPPWAHGHGHGRPRAQAGAVREPSHGTLTGTIVGVNYDSASILVGTPHGVVPIAVTPTTSIFRGSGFASLSDLGRGARVEVDFSQVDGRLVAEIIRVR